MTPDEFEKFLSDVGFSSKDDLEKIKASPELLRYLNATQAGVTKKFQSWSDEKRQLDQKLSSLVNELQRYDQALGEWEQWAQENKDFLSTYETWEPTQKGQKRSQSRSQGPEEDDRIIKLTESFEKAQQAFDKKIAQTEKTLHLYMQLSDLQRKHQDLDVNKVLDVAVKKGYTDLKKAYEDEDAYGKELFEKRANEIADTKVKDELAKRATNVETGSGSMPLSFELPKELPKSMEDAGQQFLKERQTESAKP